MSAGSTSPTNETIRRRVLKFGPAVARRLRRLRCRPSPRWHLDEIVVRIAGRRMYLWRAVHDEVEVLDVLVQRRGTRRRPGSSCVSCSRSKALLPRRSRPTGCRRMAPPFLGLTVRHEQGAEEQSGRGLPPAAPPPRTKDATLQVGRVGPALPLDARRRSQHVQPPASSALPPHAVHLQDRGHGAMALGDRSGVRSARNSGHSTRRPGSRGRPISLRQSQKPCGRPRC